MRVLLTAENGQLGWELKQALNQSVKEGQEWALGVEARFFDSTKLDITSQEQVEKEITNFQPDVVINAAAYTAVDKAEADSAKAFLVNAQGVEYLATACRKNSAYLVHVSTDFVFSANKNTPYLITDATAPLGVYGASKLAGENKAISILGDDVSIVRTAWLYSTHGRNFVKTMIHLMGNKEQLEVVSDQLGTPTSARGLAKALWLLAVKKFTGEHCQRIYHWTDLGIASWYDFSIAIQELALQKGLLQKQIPITPITSHQYPTPAKRPSYSVLDTATLRKDIGICGQHWRIALQSMIQELYK